MYEEILNYIRERSGVLEALIAELPADSLRHANYTGQMEALDRLGITLHQMQEASTEKLAPGELDPRD